MVRLIRKFTPARRLLLPDRQTTISDGSPPSAWINLSTSLRQSRQYSLAEKVVKDGLRAHKKYIGLRTEYAEIATARQDWPEAIKRWRSILKSIKDKTRLAAVYARLAAAYYKKGDYQKAEKTINDGLKYHPDHIPMHAVYAEIASARQDWPEAIKRWQDILNKFGGQAPADAWIGLVAALRKSSALAEAEKKARHGLDKYPDNPGLMIELAEIANDAKSWALAIKRWRACLRIADTAKTNLSQKIYIRFNISVLKRVINIAAYKKAIEAYNRSAKKPKVAVYTSFTKGYDILKLPEVIDKRFKYLVYSDDPVDDLGVFEVRPLNQPRFKNDGARATRYPKTHPHVLLKDYDVAVWVDTSLMIVGDIMPLIQKFMRSGKAIGSATHPTRSSLQEEMQACIDLRKDDSAVLKKQMAFYDEENFNTNDLSNNGLLMFNLKHQELAAALEMWWDQICRFSKRDQLSFNYSLYKNHVERFRLTKAPQDLRDHPNFILVPHGLDHPILNELYSLLKTKSS